LHQTAGTGFLARRGFVGLVADFRVDTAFVFRATVCDAIGFALAFGWLVDADEAVAWTLASLASLRRRFLR
jgi:hypothetical protein